MKTLAIRICSLFALLLLFALPAAAQYNDCVLCQTMSNEGGVLTWCGAPPSYSWGYEGCDIYTMNINGHEFSVCRNKGVMCYYLEVN